MRRTDLFGSAIYHLARDARILKGDVAVRELPPPLFLLLWSEIDFLCGLKQVLEVWVAVCSLTLMMPTFENRNLGLAKS